MLAYLGNWVRRSAFAMLYLGLRTSNVTYSLLNELVLFISS